MADQKSTRTPTRIGWVIVLSIAMLAGFVYAHAHGAIWSAVWDWMLESNDNTVLEAVRLALVALGIANCISVIPILFSFGNDEEIRSIIPHLLHGEIELWEALVLALMLPAAVFLAAMHVLHPCAKRFFKWLARVAERVMTVKVMKRK